MDRQPRITDLVPRRYRVFALWLVLGAAVVGGLEALYFHMPRLAAHTSDGRIAAFDLDGEGSLGAWFSSMTLGSAGLLSLVILSIRRHKAAPTPDAFREASASSRPTIRRSCTTG